MGTNRTPLVAGLFLNSYETIFFFKKKKQLLLIEKCSTIFG
jgi:hypothetical protein